MSLLQRLQLARDRNLTVANLIDELIRRKGDCDVAVLENGVFRLSALHREVCELDSFLRHTVRLKPGELVAIYRTNTRECFHWFLAIIRAGGVAVPLNPLLSLAEVRRILTDSGTQILVTDTAVFERSIGERQALPICTWIQADNQEVSLDGFVRVRDVRFPDADPSVRIDPSATVAIFHTSGTSGFPKGAALSSNALLGARASTVLTGLFLGSRDLALIALPWSHIMAVSIALYGLMAGIRGCFLEHFEVEAALQLVERLRVTAFVGVPTMLARLVNSDPAPARLSSVRVWLSASDQLPAAVRLRLRRFGALARLFGRWRIPSLVLNGYGMVELGGLAMLGVAVPWLRGSGDLCFPVPPFRVRIVDEQGHLVPPGATGECQIRRRGITPHYWRNQGANTAGDERAAAPSGQPGEGTQALLTGDGWLRTGDLARRNRLGLVRLVGRTKDVIKSGGYSVYARELEEAILAHPAVARAVAFGVPHQDKGELPVAAVELRSDASAEEGDLLRWCRGRLASYKAPKRIWVLASGELPQTHNGKFLRRALQERFADAVAAMDGSRSAGSAQS